ncbi:MAG: glycosyltransferase [Omnitrophica bacterium]|nr:glycosyltransferase [Candidatus Omnitrophota bacterium]
MSKKRILLMYISENSGHHSASLALERAFRYLSRDIELLNVNSFHYTNPILEKIVNQAYMGLIKSRPEVWGYLYDNPKVVKRTQKLKESIHKYNSQKTKVLIDGFRPDAVVCTQAFPCGVVADYKKTQNAESLVLSGVLTDYAPHSYWMYDNVDAYFVPSPEIKEHFVLNGISSDKVKITGIPINPKFKEVPDREKIAASHNLSLDIPTVLLMGGSQGIGPIKDLIKILNKSDIKLQIVAVCGSNKRLFGYMKRIAPHLNKKTVVFGYADNIHELMGISSVIITKPGGITISEALAKGLPLLIVKPIPGQEQMNTTYLVRNKVAIKAERLQDAAVFTKELLSNPQALKNLRERAKQFSKPDSAMDIAKDILERIM